MYVIGEGAYGKIYLVKKIDTNTPYAMKALKVDETEESHAYHEEKIGKEMDHPFVCAIQYVFKTEKKIYFVFELLRGGDLFSLLHQGSNRFKEDRARFYVMNIAIGIGYLHSK